MNIPQIDIPTRRRMPPPGIIDEDGRLPGEDLPPLREDRTPGQPAWRERRAPPPVPGGIN